MKKEAKGAKEANYYAKCWGTAAGALRQLWQVVGTQNEQTWAVFRAFSQLHCDSLTCASFRRVLTRKPALLMPRLHSTAEARDRIPPLSIPAKHSSMPRIRQ